MKLSESDQDIKPKYSRLTRFGLGQDASGATEGKKFTTVSLIYNHYSAFVEVVGHEGRRSLRNSLKLPLGKSRPSLYPMHISKFFRRQQGSRRSRQFRQKELRDQDHARHPNGTIAISTIGASNSSNPKFHGVPMHPTNSSTTTTTPRPSQRRSSHTTWVLQKAFSVEELT